MADFFKKSVMAGIGLFTEGSKGIQKLVDELVRKGEINSKQGEKLLKELLKKGEEAREQLAQTLHKGAEGVLNSADIATKEDIDKLNKKLASLEKKLKEMAKSK